MGHDVIAFKGSSEELTRMALTALNERVQSGDLGDFEEFQSEIANRAVATHMRRSSFDRYNKVIYTLCGAEFTYGGWSGNQGEVWLPRESIDHILAKIEHMREHGIPALTEEEMEGMKERLADIAGKDHVEGIDMHVYSVDKITGERTELTGEQKQKYLEDMVQDQGEWGSTHEDNLETEYRFFSEIKTCMDNENLDEVRIWFG